MPLADIGIIGLAVMGQNLALNLSDHHFTVAVYNRSSKKMLDFINNTLQPNHLQGYTELSDFVNSIQPPRKIMLMVKAGEAVDEMLKTLIPHLTSNDIIIDGGNSYFSDSNRRYHELSKIGIRYVAAGVSGGEEGARFGPSIMPSGDISASVDIMPIFSKIAAQVDNTACCAWIGSEGSGHFVKMIHNGIEYGDMQLIAEVYQLLHRGADIPADELSRLFKQWNKGVLDSYLIEITANILSTYDENNQLLLDAILDSAGQKGTGKWTVNAALDNDSALSLITEAVFARSLSAMKEQRVNAAKHFNKIITQFNSNDTILADIHNALYCAKIISYAQGFQLLKTAAESYQWSLDYAEIASIWRGGCIIRSRFLNDISEAYTQNPHLKNLLLAPFFTDILKEKIHSLRNTLTIAITNGIPMPAMSAALSYFDSYTNEHSPANLIQAQRDYFGAHTYERIDKPRGQFFHTHWNDNNNTTKT